MALVSKSDFAAIINVSPGRVSQFIKAGQISAAAIVGSGQRAKIDVDQARADLRLTLDISQRLGNGLDTRLDGDELVSTQTLSFDRPTVTTVTPPPSLEPPAASVDMKLKLAKLEQAERANRLAAIEDEKDRGRFTETADATKNMGRVATSMLEIFEGGLNDLASAVAAAFKLPERDVKHLLRQQYRKVRENAHRQMRLKAIELPEFIESELVAEEADSS